VGLRGCFGVVSCHLWALLFGEGGDAWEGFAFEEFEGGSAARGDVGDLVGDAGFLDGGDGVSAADDGGGVSVGGDGFGDGVCAVGEGGELEDAHGAVPDDGVGVGDGDGEELDGFGTDVESHFVLGEGAGAGEGLGVGVGREAVGEDMVGGEEKFDAVLFGFGEGGFGDVDLVGFDQRFAGGLTLCVEEGVGHAAADDDGVRLIEQVVDHVNLVGDLGSADDGDEGFYGVGDGLREVGEFFFEKEAGGGLLDVVRNALGGGVGAVGAAEGVVDVKLAELGESLGEFGIVGFFFGVKAEVFEKEGLSGLELGGEFGGDLADAVGGESDIFAWAENVVEELAEAVDDGPEAHGGDGFALGAAEVRAEDDLGLVAEGVLDGGDGLADAGVVEDLAAVRGKGDVEVDADKDALMGEVEVTDGELRHGI